MDDASLFTLLIVIFGMIMPAAIAIIYIEYEKNHVNLNLAPWDGSHKCGYCKYYKIESSRGERDKEECCYPDNIRIEENRIGNYYKKQLPQEINPSVKCEWFKHGKPISRYSGIGVCGGA